MRFLFFWVAFFLASPALATLGQTMIIQPGAISSLTSGARLQSIRPSLYLTNESQLESGTSVREYSDLNGLVFAVDWSGPVIPDLISILGIYFNIFQMDVAQARLEGRYRAPVNVSRDGVVIRSNGRMRTFFGHAYLPSLVPSGVNIGDVLHQ